MREPGHYFVMITDDSNHWDIAYCRKDGKWIWAGDLFSEDYFRRIDERAIIRNKLHECYADGCFNANRLTDAYEEIASLKQYLKHILDTMGGGLKPDVNEHIKHLIRK